MRAMRVVQWVFSCECVFHCKCVLSAVCLCVPERERGGEREIENENSFLQFPREALYTNF